MIRKKVYNMADRSVHYYYYYGPNALSPIFMIICTPLWDIYTV